MMLPMPLRMIPVIELSLSHLEIDDSCALQEGALAAHRAERLAEWSLRPLQPGSWFVPVDQFRSKRQLDLVLRVELKAEPTKGQLIDFEAIGALYGGLAVARGNEIELEPSCCCNLADLDVWRGALERGTALWIGHGNYTLETRNGIATLTIEHERVGAGSTVLRCATSELATALTHAEAERDRFAMRLEEHLRRLEIPGSREIAQRLALGR
jgi:hypothetical protein